MNYCKSIIVMLILVFGSPAIAEQNDIASKSINDDIRELLVITKAEKLGDQMLVQICKAYGKMMPDVPEDIWKKMQKEMRGADVVELIIPIYARHYNREDIRGLIAFYKSPLGEKLIASQELIMKESMVIGMKWGQEVARKIISELKSRGYKVPNTM